jgi:hypothetical protein
LTDVYGIFQSINLLSGKEMSAMDVVATVALDMHNAGLEVLEDPAKQDGSIR